MTSCLPKYLRYLRRRHPTRRSATAGFTLAETLVVIVMFGVLTAIAAPSWLAFVNRQRINSAGDAVLQTVRKAQTRASTENRLWEASFRINDEGYLEGTAYAVAEGDGNPIWEVLSPSSGDFIDISRNYTTIDNGECNAGDYCVQFQDRGVVGEEWENAQGSDSDSDIGRITLISSDRGEDGPKRCVVVATLLGTVRIARDEGCEI